VSIISNPKKLKVPDEPFYPIDRLYLFDRQDRLSWEKNFGEQAPPWDKRCRKKCWADTSVLAGVDDPDASYVEYDYFDLSSRSFKKMKLTVREASRPNLPGRYVYPEYIIEPTPAVMMNPDGGEQPLNPRILCYKAEAEQVARELGAAAVVESKAFRSGPFVIHWNGEQRRMWLVRLGANYLSAAALVQAKAKNGVGAPGKWQVLESGQPVWIAEPQETGEHDPRPEVPIPCRRLAENEALYLGHPMKVVVYRTDMESEYNQPGGADSGAFPADLRTTLERIDANVQQLLALAVMDAGKGER